MYLIVVGAGPAGLYTAIKLRKAGIRDLVVYDPRAKEYIRPGHLNKNVFEKVEEGIDKKFWLGQDGHIKELERILYAEARALGIAVEKKYFKGLHPDPDHPGILIADNEHSKAYPVEADYVFDCTGASRAVVHALNRMSLDPPLKLKAFTELPVSNHMLAYVKMSKPLFEQFTEAEQAINGLQKDINALSFAQSIVKLSALGWNALQFPRCYGVSFGKEKICLYLQAPVHLAAKDRDQWLQTVLECYLFPIHYVHLPSSKKYAYKPRITTFHVSANALEKVSYKAMDLPTIIALGDAQIDSDYYLAHGIYNGVSRINALFDVMKIQEGRIVHFDSTEYQTAIKELLHEHKSAIIIQAMQQRRSFYFAIRPARKNLELAILQSCDEHEKTAFKTILEKIQPVYTSSAYREELARKEADQSETKSPPVKATSISDFDKPLLFFKRRVIRRIRTSSLVAKL